MAGPVLGILRPPDTELHGAFFASEVRLRANGHGTRRSLASGPRCDRSDVDQLAQVASR